MARKTRYVEPMAKMFRILGDQTRLKIVMLLTAGEMNVTQICKKLKAPQPSVSHHLGLLRMGELVQTRRMGKEVFYSLSDLEKHPYAKGLSNILEQHEAIEFGPVVLGMKSGKAKTSK